MIAAQAIGDGDKATRRKQFTENYQNLNIKREQAGLKPLEWCDEIRKFDPEWAKEQKCEKRMFLPGIDSN